MERTAAFRRAPAPGDIPATSRSAPGHVAASAPPSGAASGRALQARLLRTGLLASAVAIVLAAAFLLDMLAATRARAVDLLLLARPVRPATATVIVGVDERSAERLRPRYGPVAAWPRSLYARALEALREASPRLVGLAVLFDDPAPETTSWRGDPPGGQRRHAGGGAGGAGLRPAPRRRAGVRRFVRPTRAVRDAAADEGW